MSATPVAATTTAVTATAYGPVAGVRAVQIAMPEPASGQVRMQVHAASVNPADVFGVVGSPWPVRLATGLRRPRRPVVGHDVAGVVDAVGPGVTGVAVGDRMFGEGRGTFAEHGVADVARLAAMPAAWSFAEAAAVPMAGTTAVQLLRDGVGPLAGKRILVIGAGGGIGTFLVALAAREDAEVTAVCSAGKHELVRSLGASETIDHATTDVTEHPGRYDAIIDNVAADTFRRLLPLLRPGGVLVTNSGTGDTDGGALGRPLRAALLRTFARRPVRTVICSTRADDLAYLAELGQAGLAPVVGATYPLARAAEALHEVADGHARGKVVITVRGDGEVAPRARPG